MPKQAAESLRGGGVGESQIKPVTGRVTAQPLNTAVAPGENDFSRLANALQGFMPGFNQYAAQEQKLVDQENQATAVVAANATDLSTMDESIRAFSTDATPEAQQTFRAALGARMGREAAAAFAQHAEANFDPNNPDPKAAQQFATEYFTKNSQGMADPIFLAEYQKATSEVAGRFSRDHIGSIVKQHEQQKIANVTSAVQSYLENDATRPDDWVDQLKASNLYLDKVSVEATAWSATVEKAVNDGKPELLEAFTRDTVDGQKGLVYRGGAETLKQYLDAKDRATKAFKTKFKGKMQEQEDNARTFMSTKLQDIETGAISFDESDLQGIFNTIDGLAAAGVFGDNYAEATSSYRTKFYKAYTDIEKVRPVAQAMVSGGATHQLSLLDKADRERAIKLALRENPGMNPRELSVRNGMIYPEDAQALVNTANFISNSPTGEVPPGIDQAFQVMQYYMTVDGGSKKEVFLQNLQKENPEAFHFWTNMQGLMHHEPNKTDLVSLTNAAKILTSNRSNKVRYEGQSASEVVDKVRKEIAKNGNFWSNAAETNNTYVNSWILRELDYSRNLNPQATDDSMMKTAAAKFQATHVLVGKSWMDISTIPHAVSKEEGERMGEALEAYKNVAALKFSANMRFGWTAEDIKDMEVTVRPQPAYFNKGGEPLFHVFVGGQLIDEAVDIQQLTRQYYAKETVNDPVLRGKAEEIETRLHAGYQTATDYTPVQATSDREMLQAAHAVGLYSDKQFKELNTLIENHEARAKGEEFKMADRSRETAALSNPVFKPMAAEPEADLMVKARPANDLMDAKLGSVHTYVKEQAAGSNPQFALAALVYGRSGMTYEQDGEKRLGFGFSFDESNPKTLREALSKANVVGNIGFDTMKSGLRDKRSRLSSGQIEKLWNHQLAVAQKQVTDVMGVSEFSVGTPGMQYGLTTLVTTLGNPSDVPKALEAIKSGNFNALTSMMTRVPQQNRESALAYIRTMMAGTSKFKALVNQRTPDR